MSSADMTVKFWDVDGGQETLTFRLFPHEPAGVAFSPGKRIVRDVLVRVRRMDCLTQ
jgi:hypothetical protein